MQTMADRINKYISVLSKKLVHWQSQNYSWLTAQSSAIFLYLHSKNHTLIRPTTLAINNNSFIKKNYLRLISSNFK